MDYERQVKAIAKYFEDNEKEIKDFKMGLEIEHFIIDKDSFRTISYYEEKGTVDTLEQMLQYGWEGIYEGDNILGLKKNGTTITLEPGSQFELSIRPEKHIFDLERDYFNFLNEVLPILDRKNQALITTGYQPESSISDIKIIPKKRYSYMYEYFKDKGTHAHNMMKGTASLQLSVDYNSEKDFVKKFRVASAISPVIYQMFDNAYYFEGGVWDKSSLRSYIWENCDKDRCGIVDVALDKSFGYEKYAEYILNRPPIFIDNGKEVYFTKDKLTKDIFDPDKYSTQELEHILTMFFPDVRAKKYIEIRMMDGVPYPLNFSAVALWKGIIYDEENLNKIYEYVDDISIEDVNKAKKDIVEKGLYGKLRDETVYEIGKRLIELSKSGLRENELKYILPLEEMFNEKMTPRGKTEKRAYLGKKKALDWCILNNLIEVKDNGHEEIN
ncbi:glutamate--cysteine ligase [Sporanaerobacter acetigenes]|uniref:Glutamate--cysteine ligase n=1 Tax=Sporanaerobacter acetigenes DSM 13106 TaxID=1123281 RepID=A0A1M5SQD0_9FIRM|nr:glutamate-cysteine ligase family protein [Sporanaerobacter acetigenes]SHH40705.1 glutamate--cysteine ligase [Sporanaerobacter acetigenes DSM 13106]